MSDPVQAANDDFDLLALTTTSTRWNSLSKVKILNLES